MKFAVLLKHHSTRIIQILIVIAICVLLALLATHAKVPPEPAGEQGKAAAITEPDIQKVEDLNAEASESDDQAVAEIAEEPEEDPYLPSIDLKQLERSIKSELESYDGKWSVYVKQLGADNNYFVINEEPQKSASVMKLFIMGAVYDEIHNGDLEEKDVQRSLEQMITLSDNAAANHLLSVLGHGSYSAGIARVNQFIEDYHFTHGTQEYNGFENRATFVGAGVNIISSVDCGEFLEQVYNRTLVSYSCAYKMNQLLAHQTHRVKIPYLLPEDTVIMNKTGETNKIHNDIAIVLSPNCDYVVCILSTDWHSEATAIKRIQELSLEVYEYFNPPEDETDMIEDTKTASDTAEVEIESK